VALRAIVPAFDVLGAVVMVAIIVGTTPLLIESIERGYYIGEQGIFTFPEWPLRGMVVVGSLMTLACFLARTVLFWRTPPGEYRSEPAGEA
jgi:hypothetical protein